MKQIAEDVWILRFPLTLLGMRIGRTVTVIRLHSGTVVIHSTAPFSETDVATISALGSPVALIEATLFHDTCAEAGTAAFPKVPYYAPPGLADKLGAIALGTTSEPWAGELEMVRIEGAPSVQEHVFFHHASRTLIVADLVFNLDPNITGWTRFFFRWVAGLKRLRGMSRMFRLMIRDRTAFTASVRRMMEWDFDRVIVGHGDVIETGGKQVVSDVLASGWVPGPGRGCIAPLSGSSALNGRGRSSRLWKRAHPRRGY